MGKLVLGILFVILLQIVFFGYTSRYWSTSNESGLVKSRPYVPRLSRPADLPQDSPAASSVTETPAPTDKLENRQTVAQVRPPVRTESIDRARQPRPREVVPHKTLTIPVGARPENEQLSAVAPRRYAVIVTDDLTNTVSRRWPISEPKKRSLLTDDLAQTRASRTEVAEPKKRSLLSKSYSVVVKKPWGWMKSLASKLR